MSEKTQRPQACTHCGQTSHNNKNVRSVLRGDHTENELLMYLLRFINIKPLIRYVYPFAVHYKYLHRRFLTTSALQAGGHWKTRFTILGGVSDRKVLTGANFPGPVKGPGKYFLFYSTFYKIYVLPNVF